MATPLATGDFTPRYATIFVVGVIIGTAIRAVRWVLPTSVAERWMERLLA